MEKISPNEVIETVLSVIETTYGNLGFLSFQLHSIKPNTKEGVYIIKYSFIPRGKDDGRIFYLGKVNINNKNIFEIEQIKKAEVYENEE